MTLAEIINIIRNDFGNWAIIFIILSSLIEFSPIKINPISVVFNWLSKKFNKNILDRLDKMEAKLDEHISESDERDIRRIREKILSFGTSCMNGRKHTKEEYDFIIAECDKYERHCTENKIPNGVATATIAEIRKLYAECMHNNSFLQ